MKGAFLILTEATHSFITDAMHDIGEVYSDERAGVEPEEVLLDLVLGKFDDPSGLQWIPEEDKFGKKAYTSRPYAQVGQPGAAGELRVTLVLKGEEMFTDIRVWGQY